MKITIFSSNQPRHLNLAREFSLIADEVFLISEVNTVFPGIIDDHFSKSKINILFLDEVINVLDDSGREKMVEVLLQEDLNTYVVSHGWTHPLLEKIEVVKDGNVSRLEW